MIRRVSLTCLALLGAVLLPVGAAAQASAATGSGAVDNFAPAADSAAPTGSHHVAASSGDAVPVDATAVFGLSGSLRVAVLTSEQAVAPPLLLAAGIGDDRPLWTPLHGTRRPEILGEPVFRGEVVAPATPGIWRLGTEEESYVASPEALTFITSVPFQEKRGSHLNGYHIGVYPTEGSGRADVYAPPTAFVEVTAENQDVQISEHFRLRQFLTKDQFDVWPKYVVLNLRLIDKLELVIQELNAMGVRALRMHVMSGFRTPQYNGPGGDGRATLSRHMYGDAADIWVDGDDDGLIDDLNGDGRSDIHDAALLLHAVERVEQKYPELTGGAGLYESNDSHGPYVHVDVRGIRARW